MKLNLGVFFLLFSVLFVNAQNDSLPQRILFDGNANGFQIDAKIIEEKLENDISNKSDVDLSYLFKTPKTNLPLSYKFNLNRYLDPNKKTTKSILEKKKLPEDVLVIKHFNGIDQTVTKLKTSQNLGTITNNTDFIRLEYRDFGLVDGDRIRVFLNEKPLEANVELDGMAYTLKIDLPKNRNYNRIDIQALNQGVYGPNTAEFVLYDDKGNVIAHKTWNLKTNQNATLGIIRN